NIAKLKRFRDVSAGASALLSRKNPINQSFLRERLIKAVFRVRFIETVVPVLLAVLALLLPAGCSVENVPGQQIREYSTRLARVLDEPMPEVSVTPAPNLPRTRDLALPGLAQGGAMTLNPLEYLRLGECELQNLIAGRNSGLGKLARPSQRLVYEVQFLALVEDCVRIVSAHEPELALMLSETADAKRRLLPGVIWQATLGGTEFRTLWQMHLPVQIPRLPSGLELTLARLAANIERWLAGDYRIDSGEIESLLDEIRRANVGGHLRQWLVVRDELVVATKLLAARTAGRPLCFPGMDRTSGEILDTVVRQRLIGVIQPQVARLNRDYHEVLPQIRRIETMLAGAEPPVYAEWRTHRDELASSSLAAIPDHIRALEPLLEQCGLLPG
ncbi:MAG: DUF3080 family protein, partial [Proteobacteria bacterium]|nr:DUF3080 family protein [Pseudomonadota bacterium]